MLTDGTTELTEEKAPRKDEGDRQHTHHVWTENLVESCIGRWLGTVTVDEVKEFCLRFPGLLQGGNAALRHAIKILNNDWTVRSNVF